MNIYETFTLILYNSIWNHFLVWISTKIMNESFESNDENSDKLIARLLKMSIEMSKVRVWMPGKNQRACCMSVPKSSELMAKYYYSFVWKVCHPKCLSKNYLTLTIKMSLKCLCLSSHRQHRDRDWQDRHSSRAEHWLAVQQMVYEFNSF